MPRAGQINLKYQVPHVETFINDNSSVSNLVSETSAELGVKILCVFTSERGEDGVVKTIDNTSAFVKEYGTPDFVKHGQANLMPYLALRTGYAHCHCLRIAADDATFATSVIVAKVEKVTDGDMSYASVTFKSEPLKDSADKLVTDKSKIEKAFADFKNGSTTEFPLFVVYSKGRGEYGNKLSYIITPDNETNTQNNFMNYSFNIYDNESLVEVKSGSFASNAVVSGKSLWFDDVINDPDTGSAYIDFISSETNIENFINACKTDITGTNAEAMKAKLNLNSFNIFTGLTKDGLQIKDSANKVYYKLAESSETNVVKFDDKTLIKASEGSDGKFSTTYTTQHTKAIRDAAINAVLVKAFEGKVAHEIRSKKRLPCDYMFDANYADSVKRAMAECAIARGDSRLILDAGIENKTIEAITTWYSNKFADTEEKYEGKDLDDYFFISKECQWYKTRDPFTNRVIPVTMTYFIAETLPTHVFNNGNQIPFVGSQYATITDHISRSIKPFVDADDLENKEKLYNNRFNFVECTDSDVYSRATQVTSQKTVSDLSEESNVDVLLEMKRMLEDFTNSTLYNFADSEDRVTFTEDAVRLFNTYTNNKVSSYDVYFNMNEFERERSILHCYLAVTFRGFNKRSIVEIDINKRTS